MNLPMMSVGNESNVQGVKVKSGDVTESVHVNKHECDDEITKFKIELCFTQYVTKPMHALELQNSDELKKAIFDTEAGPYLTRKNTYSPVVLNMFRRLKHF